MYCMVEKSLVVEYNLIFLSLNGPTEENLKEE